MHSTEKILVPTGLSEFTEELVHYAAKIAHKLDGELIIATVINSRDVDAITRIASFGYEVDSDHYVESIMKERKEILSKITASSTFLLKKVRTVFIVGNPVEELLQLIVEEDIDIIVMGIKDKTNMDYSFIGSVAEKIFRKSPAIVISYRDQKQSEKLRKKISKRIPGGTDK